MSNKIINLHHADFDGAISGACMKVVYGNSGEYIPTAIGKVNETLNKIVKLQSLKDTTIFLTDLSIGPDNKELINLIKTNKIIIYDHHINPFTEKLFEDIPKHNKLDSKICGATITWLELLKIHKNNTRLKAMEDIVLLSDVYDMWRTNHIDFDKAVGINDLLSYKIGYTPAQFRDRFVDNPQIQFSKKERKIMDIQLKHRDVDLTNMMDDGFINTFKNHNFYITECDSPTDYTKYLLMNELIDKGIDMFIFKFKNTTQCSVRIPPNSKILDLNVWYDDIGCVGHKSAGGIPSTEYHKLIKLLN